MAFISRLAKKVGAQDASHKSWITVKPILRMKLCKPIKHAVDKRVLFSFKAIRGNDSIVIRPIHRDGNKNVTD